MPCQNHPEVSTGLVTCSSCHATFCSNCVVMLGGSPVCAQCKVQRVRDIQSGVPVGRLDLAGIGRRFGGIFIDSLVMYAIFLVVMIPVGVVAAFAGGDPDNPVPAAAILLGYLLGIGTLVAYEAVMLSWRGQTLGKMAVKVKVVNPDGTDIRAGQAWVRGLAKMFLGFMGATYWPALFTKEKTCLHDMLAKTRVVHLR
jgi:uncharacterized RDD family membrane protein YckC